MNAYVKNALVILKHKWFVIIAGLKVGGIPVWRLLIHDLSKFSPTEFVGYTKRKIDKNFPDEKWRPIWLHHIHHNPHHWEHWVLIKNNNIHTLPMPISYVREMVADWLAAGRGYKDSWDIKEWLVAEVPKMSLHLETIKAINNVFRELHLPYQLNCLRPELL
jgi:hypothetical protein